MIKNTNFRKIQVPGILKRLQFKYFLKCKCSCSSNLKCDRQLEKSYSLLSL
jgi:hypothetical protein